MSRIARRTPGRKVRTVVTPVLAIAMLLTSGVSASLAAESGTSSSATGSEEAPSDPAGYHAPTLEELAAKREEAARLAAAVTDQEKALADAQKRIDELATTLSEARAAEATATATEAAARAEQDAQNKRLLAAQQLVSDRKDEMGRWASQTYRNGGNLGSVEGVMTLLESDNTDDMAQRMQMLQLVGRWRGSVVDTVEEAQAVQADATVRAAAAAEQATVAHTQAAAARATAEDAVTEQTSQIMLMTALLNQTRNQAAAAQAATNSMSAALMGTVPVGQPDPTNRITGSVDPNCPGGDISVYPNGQIPEALMCPLWAAPGHMLRADAAYAFNQMSQAYAAQFGAPICVTDSYRDLAGQIAVKAAKPGLAATPGTSRHGLGRAVDLCGGIQSFGTPQHIWMQQNAPTYGWYDPLWARSNGSKPEPWHWQYQDWVH